MNVLEFAESLRFKNVSMETIQFIPSKQQRNFLINGQYDDTNIVTRKVRQCGYSLVTCVMLLYKAKMNNNSIIGVFDHKNTTTQEILKRIVSIVNCSDLGDFKIVKNSQNYIEFSNGSKIQITGTESIIGMKFDYLFWATLIYTNKNNIETLFNALDTLTISNTTQKQLFISITYNDIDEKKASKFEKDVDKKVKNYIRNICYNGGTLINFNSPYHQMSEYDAISKFGLTSKSYHEEFRLPKSL